MCGRYRLKKNWQAKLRWERLQTDLFHDEKLWQGSEEIFPRTWQPIIRLDDGGSALVELRRWGFHRTWPDKAKPDKWIKRELINAVGDTVGKLPTFKRAFNQTRCLVPLSAWWEWSEAEVKKTRMEISMRSTDVFLAAGLYETSKDNKSGEPVETYTIVTTEPNEVLGSVHDRAPLIIQPHDWDKWLDSAQSAQTLIHAYPDLDEFKIERAPNELQPVAR